MTKKLKKRLYRILLGTAIFAIAMLISSFITNLNENVRLALFLLAYFIIGGDIVKKAVSNIGRGQVFDENFLMTIATVGAFLVGDYPEGIAVMLFYQVGELFQYYAVNRSRKSISDLMDIRPDYAYVVRNQETIEVDPNEVQIGETILVKPGEKIPLDGIITKGNTSLDTMALTGESVPREALLGDDVISGCVNITGVIEVEVSKIFGESTVSKILNLVENAAEKKAESENFITRFAKYYTPIVVIGALLLGLIPPLILGGGWGDWIYRALTFLVISCPCALVISIPLSFFGGLGGASKNGILVKGSNYLELLSQAEIVVMDKTGTITKGNFAVSGIYPHTITKELLLEIAAYAESYSNHPISLSLRAAYEKEIDKTRLGEVEEIPGHGIVIWIDGTKVAIGNAKLMEVEHIPFTDPGVVGTIVYVAQDGAYLGAIAITDEIKESAYESIQLLKNAGVRKIVMLTGDKKEIAKDVADKVGITEVFAQLLPGDKVECMERLLTERSQKGKLVFVGDGVNDAPVIARADVGVAMGGIGSDAAIEAADVVIMTDELNKIATAMQISKKTLRIVKQNIVFALGIKALVLILAAFGMATMWAAVFADVGVSVIAILNAMRAMYYKKGGI